MKKRRVFVLVLLIVGTSLAFQATGSATDAPVLCQPVKGCTPGYWKQPKHYDSWVGYSADDLFSTVFGAGPDVTLLDALKQGGGGEKAFMRHSVAALLNAAHPDVCYAGRYGNEGNIKWFVSHTYVYDAPPFEYKKDILEGFNEVGCPLD